MLEQILSYLRNYFVKEVHHGDFAAVNGALTIIDGEGASAPCDFLQTGQYFRILGSIFNDGVYQYPVTNLRDEEFSGVVWAMAVPPAVVTLATTIGTWVQDNSGALNSPYQSESFGGYSYSKASGTSANGAGSAYGWQDQFAKELAPYKKIRIDVNRSNDDVAIG